MEIVNINGVELKVNFADVDFVEKFEQVTMEMLKKNDETRNDKSLRPVEGMRRTCQIVNEYLDSLFGEGTAESIFHGTSDVLEHLEAVDAISGAQDNTSRALNNLSNKYVQKNRANINRQNKAQMNQFVAGKH